MSRFSKAKKLKRIAEYTLNRFTETLEKGIIVHDIDIARWASRAQEKENVSEFKASETWVKIFKIKHDIVSQKNSQICNTEVFVIKYKTRF